MLQKGPAPHTPDGTDGNGNMVNAMQESLFQRAELLLGNNAMARLGAARVLLFGVGGVGSWVAEGLIRSGVGHLTLVDGDTVAPSNVNRQLMATTATIGRPKVDAMREHLLQVNPAADIVARQERFSARTADAFDWQAFDCVVDAIDSVADKLELIVRATDKTQWRQARRPLFFSSMGAALKCDPTQVRVSEFWEVDGCPLAATLRRRMRRAGRYPGHKFKCTWSPEVVHPGTPRLTGQPNGSLVQITAIMGFTLAGLIINEISHT